MEFHHPHDDPGELTVRDLAEQLGIPVTTVLDLIRSGVERKSRKTKTDRLPSDPDVLTVRQTADKIGLTEDTVVRLLKDGVLPGRKLGHQWRCYWPAIIESLSDREPPAHDGPMAIRSKEEHTE
ncbi:hypothetical protein GCM10012275_60780 [Longimycelium tulufanense]|uniref:Helix-turn-helix domain-containing protein n=1 Tax=Longimycelium tulufanense TaxID=907463 RepID=A0A8J3CKG5_9PSEU|nr:helix-turn-helix domain-containing protein [Longimycelium tulufanense]GGM81994.1 hypothetical protein GCM10012275_60780 [Longimycelium tulufanense]